MITVIDGKLFSKMFISAANNLENHKAAVNDMNVFPVPDGDTGTNMALTVKAAAGELLKYPDGGVSGLADCVAKASLRGARGNSGVILSQLLRGMQKGTAGLEVLDCAGIANAFRSAAEVAYKAVMKPTEGTILTVAREMAEFAVREQANFENAQEFLEKIVEEGKRSLERTPELLPVLKQANVVDSGGMGLVTLLSGALYALKNDAMIEVTGEQEKSDGGADFSDFDEENSPFTYCTEFIIVKHNPKTKTGKLKNDYKTKGDCVLVIDDGEIVKVHIHTDNPGLVLQEALLIGQLTNIKIDNMKEQAEQKAKNMPKEKYGFVAVAQGDGIDAILKDMGVRETISGGQTMNPSADDILQAIRKTNAETVFVFPNNKNIILAAEAAKELESEKEVVIIPTRNIPQCITALMNFDKQKGVKENTDVVMEVISTVKTISVTYAVRDSEMNGKTIREGDMIAVSDKEIVANGKDASAVAMDGVGTIYDEDAGIITIYYGESVNEDTAEELKEKMEEKYDDCDVELYFGGQSVYSYIISVE